MADPTEVFRSPDHKVATIFGGSGFIGRHIVRRLAKRGWRLRIAVRHPSKAQFLKPLGDVGQIAPIRCDIAEEASIATALAGTDYVINLVGILAEGGGQSFEALHATAPGRIARLAKEAGATRMVQISAIGASADSPSTYARTKAAGEAAVREGFPEASILRPSVVFGPEDSFFNMFAEMTRTSPFLPLIGGGETRFQPVFVGDVAEAVTACLDRPETQGQVYELGGPRIYTFKELMELLLKTIGRKRALLPIPWGMAEIQARVFECLPKPPLTRDQVTQLKSDNVVQPGAKTLADLGIEPMAAEGIIPTYLERFRRGGRFARRHAA